MLLVSWRRRMIRRDGAMVLRGFLYMGYDGFLNGLESVVKMEYHLVMRKLHCLF